MKVRASRPEAPVQVLFVVLPETLLLDLAGPAEAFRLANQQLRQAGQPAAFEMLFAGPRGEARSSVGLLLADLRPLPARLDSPTWVVLLGRPGEAGEVVRREPPWMLARQWLADVVAPALQAADTPHRLLTVCVGALLAADAGLLAGRAVTTHHELLDELAHIAPSAQVHENRLFVQDGPVWTSAGITAGIDLALQCIAGHSGEALAAAVAQVMVVFHRRGAADPQLSPLLRHRSHLHPAVQRVQTAVTTEPSAEWTAERLAEVAHVTPRHLGRLFRAHAGLSPQDFVQAVRLARADDAIAAGMARQQAASWAGFTSERQWRRARAARARSGAE
ncbi:MAG: helix-turn-helix domain-containing protein [Vitreoscilla sp.]|jgi:transcriptional regulator GlxA family with amidase domain|nr:helix-turn-helix domain-containing protein [Vitreoscilla sp.]